MHVGVCQIQLRLPENGTLKDKRQVVRSVTSRTRHKFNVSIAEVADNESWQLATLGITSVSNSARHADEVLGSVVADPLGNILIDHANPPGTTLYYRAALE